jgi:5-methylcytosine-specific restriction endonuclease McrA
MCSKSCAAKAKFAPQSAVTFDDCRSCGAVFVKRGSSVLCRPCKAVAALPKEPKPERAPVYRATAITYVDCAECGTLFIGHGVQVTYCSTKCTTKARRRRTRIREKANGQRRGKATPGMVIEQFTMREIAVRDGWRCHLCGKKVPDRSYRARDKDPTIDHIIPRSEGGDHTRANVALAHNRCNWEKAARAVGEQLRLIG